MLRALIHIRRAMSILGILALLGAGFLSAAVPVHAAPAQSGTSQAVPPCHNAKAAASFDFCKERCLAASPERFVGFAVSGHVFPGKVAVVFAAISAVEPPPEPLSAAPAHYYLHRHYSSVPTYLRNQRLLI